MAPRLPSAEDLGLPGSLAVGRPVVGADTSPLTKGALALAKGAQDLGSGLYDLAEKENRKADALGKAKADAGFVRDHTALLTEQANKPDPEAYEKRSRELVAEHAANLTDPRQRELWSLAKEGSVANGQQHVARLAHRAAGDTEMTNIGQSADDAQEAIRNNPDPRAHEEIISAVGARVDAAAERGFLTREQADDYKKKFALRSMRTSLGLQPTEDQVAVLEGPAQTRDQAVDRIGRGKSGGNATAKNPLSSATGAHQFTSGTWLGVVQQHRPDLLQGRSQEQVLALRNDPTLSKEMAGHLYDDNLAALKAKGLPANPGTGYLAHFAGIGGATALLRAAPGTPVSDVLDEKAIAANRRILEGKTAGSVVRWAARQMGEGPEQPGLSAIPADTRQVWLDHARSQLAAEQRQAQRAQQDEAAALRARISDDLASTEATGQGNAQLNADQIEQAFGPQAARDWQQQRARAYSVHTALDGIAGLPEGEIERRLQGLQPKPGVEGYADDMAAYVKARKQADRLIEARRADPALAVDALPAVKEARAAAQYEQTETGRQIRPESAQAVVRARLATQNQLGLPEPMAVTKSEAGVIGRQLRAIGDEDTAGLRRFMGQLQATYGDYADEVLSATIQHQNVNRDLAVSATDVLGKLARGQLPSEQDRRRLDRAGAGQRMDDALAGRGPAAAAPQAPSQPRTAAPRVPEPGLSPEAGDWQNAAGDLPPAQPQPGEMRGAATGEDIQALARYRGDPAVLREFNAVYGDGTAERALAEVDRRFGTGGQR